MAQIGRIRALLVVVLTPLAIVLAAAPAAAHTELVTSEPAAGTSVSDLERVVLRFESVVETAGSHVWIEDAGRVLPLAPAEHFDGDPTTLMAPVPSIAAGSYAVGWHVVAADGTPASGAVPFRLTTPPAAPTPVAAEPQAPAAPSAPVVPAATSATVHHSTGKAPVGAARVLLDASLATLLGGLAFVVTVWPQGASLRRTAAVLWSAAAMAAAASLFLAVVQHANATGLGIGEALAPAHLRASMQFRFGQVAAARLVLLAAGAVLTGRLLRGGERTARSVLWCTGGIAVAVGLLETIVLSGHEGGTGGLAAGARLVHSAGVSVWLGGLLMLLVAVLPRRRPEEIRAVLPRFSRFVTVAVGALLGAGLLLSVDLVGGAGLLPTSGYGRVLTGKLVVVALLLAAATRSRAHVRRRIVTAGAAGGPGGPGAGPIATWIGVELGLMALVLGLTAVLLSQTPPG